MKIKRITNPGYPICPNCGEVLENSSRDNTSVFWHCKKCFCHIEVTEE